MKSLFHNPSVGLAASMPLLAGSSLLAATHYVSLEGTHPTPPYTNWSTAATNIQDAADAAVAADEIVVSNGVYALGQTESFDNLGISQGTNRVTITNALLLRSINGPEFTTIDGGGTNRCLRLADGARLSGFTLTNGYAEIAGGVYCASTNAFIANCIVTGNQAAYGCGGAASGTLYDCTLSGNAGAAWSSILCHCKIINNSGGTAECTLYDCTLSGNSDAAARGTLYNCTLSGNSAVFGGAAYGCTLYNCILTENQANSGGGACLSTLYGCTLSGNSAVFGGAEAGCQLFNCTLSNNFALRGGGASGVVFGPMPKPGAGLRPTSLNNCLLIGNSAEYGGGAYVPENEAAYLLSCSLSNCTLVDNIASETGGGVAGRCLLYNCIVAYNAAWTDDNYTTSSVLNYCCTVPLSTNGLGNITGPPQFADYANGNLRLQSESPCINSGNNAGLVHQEYDSDHDAWLWVTNRFDLDGNPRIVSGTVDIGAYEFQGNGSLISYAWLHQFGLATDGSEDFIDSDQDGLNNWQEWVCGTCPTNPASALWLLSATPNNTDVAVTWQSVAGVSYLLERSLNLTSSFTLLATNILGQAGTTTFADTNATGAGPFFYRVGVQHP